MRFVWTQFLALSLTVILTGSGLYTSGYFFDIEVAAGNVLGAAALDGELTGEGIVGETCPLPERLDTTLTFENVGGLPFRYDVSVASTSGGACARLKAELTRNDEQVFMGKLVDLRVQNLPLTPGDADVFHLAVFSPGSITAADPTCSFTTGFTAHQEGLFSGDAYFDNETRRHEVTVLPKLSGAGGDTTIIIEQNTDSETDVDVSAESSDASANGGSGGAGGNGGNASGPGAVGGDGGNGGPGGAGGVAQSGDASATVSVVTEGNSSSVVVNGCGCTQCGCTEDDAAHSESAEAVADTDTDIERRDLERSPRSPQTSSREEHRRERSTRRFDRSSSESAHATHAASDSAGASEEEETQPESAAAGEGTDETVGEAGDDDAEGGDGADSDADGDS